MHSVACCLLSSDECFLCFLCACVRCVVLCVLIVCALVVFCVCFACVLRAALSLCIVFVCIVGVLRQCCSVFSVLFRAFMLRCLRGTPSSGSCLPRLTCHQSYSVVLPSAAHVLTSLFCVVLPRFCARFPSRSLCFSFLVVFRFPLSASFFPSFFRTGRGLQHAHMAARGRAIIMLN